MMLGGQALVRKAPIDFQLSKKVGLISDTHIPKRARELPKRVFEVFEKVDYIIHSGDLVELDVVDELEQLAPVLAVYGNMDGADICNALPRLNSLRVFDWKIGVMHDPNIINGLNYSRELVKQNSFDVFIYGHTHVPIIKWEGKTLFMNPGSPTEPASIMLKPSVGILNVTRETITPEIIDL
ncbi:MAG: metallophosphoesterase [Betaproteobacteria bacterium]